LHAKLELILKTAVVNKASDIHLQSEARPHLRVKGKLVPLGKDPEADALTDDECREIIYATMSPETRETYLREKEVDYALSTENYGRFRINAYTSMGKHGLVARLLVSDPKSLDDLGAPSVLKDVASLATGLVLVTGETGSGKSSTLAGMIKYINDNRARRIFTVEDPVEIMFKNNKSLISQREVGTDTKSWEAALRSVLREDPNVILIGEIRNKETMKIAINAAETGHLVFATLHTTNAGDTINRILGFFEESERPQIRNVLAQCLESVICQRLTRDVNDKFVPVTEVMRKNLRVSEAIRDETKTHNLYQIIEASSFEKMQTFEQCLLNLVGNAIITPEKALTLTEHPGDLSKKLKQIVR
jgi:twitching motility protein PilT